MLAYLQRDGQGGFSPPISTEASLGFPAMAYQSSDMLFDSRERDKIILARLEGATSRGRSAPKSELAQRANVGYRSC